jgi:hypothetical protein
MKHLIQTQLTFYQEKHEDDSLPLGALGKSIVVADSNLSNLIANVLHDMQVLELAPTATQQTMNLLI